MLDAPPGAKENRNSFNGVDPTEKQHLTALAPRWGAYFAFDVRDDDPVWDYRDGLAKAEPAYVTCLSYRRGVEASGRSHGAALPQTPPGEQLGRA
jgi:hypothetical protein